MCFFLPSNRLTLFENIAWLITAFALSAFTAFFFFPLFSFRSNHGNIRYTRNRFQYICGLNAKFHLSNGACQIRKERRNKTFLSLSLLAIYSRKVVIIFLQINSAFVKMLPSHENGSLSVCQFVFEKKEKRPKINVRRTVQ
jgi:hypothetical protein